jgi:very-short-patch-repair endonuclease
MHEYILYDLMPRRSSLKDRARLTDVDMFYGKKPSSFGNARVLRGSETNGEQILWAKLQKKQIDGFRFRRHHSIGGFGADFYCHQAKLVIEVDREFQATQEQIKYDAARTSEITALGITILRFSNKEIETEIEEVINQIKNTLKILHPFKPPLQGRLEE